MDRDTELEIRDHVEILILGGASEIERESSFRWIVASLQNDTLQADQLEDALMAIEFDNEVQVTG